jgi:hypothetical protein
VTWFGTQCALNSVYPVRREQYSEHHTAKYLDIERQQELNDSLLSHKDTSIIHTHARTNTLIRSVRVLGVLVAA